MEDNKIFAYTPSEVERRIVEGSLVKNFLPRNSMQVDETDPVYRRTLYDMDHGRPNILYLTLETSQAISDELLGRYEGSIVMSVEQTEYRLNMILDEKWPELGLQVKVFKGSIVLFGKKGEQVVTIK